MINEQNSEKLNKKQGLKGFYFYYSGQVISLFGSALTSFVLFWYIAIISKDVILLAIMALLTTLPSIVIMPLAGVFIDRWNKKLLLGLSDFLQAMTTLVILWFLYNDQNGFVATYPTIYYILIFVGVKNIFQAFQQPTFQAVVPIMIPEDKLVQNNSIMSLANALIELLSPVIAGVLLAFTPVTTLLWIDIITFFIGIIPLFFIHIPSVLKRLQSNQPLKFTQEFSEGIDAIKKSPGLIQMLILFTFVNFTFAPINIIYPFIIKTIQNGTALDFALIMLTMQITIIITSIILATIIKIKSLVFGVIVGILGIYVGFIITAFAPRGQLEYIFVGAAIIGLMLTVARISAQTIWQKAIPKNKQGRVASIRMTFSTAISPIGNVMTALLVNVVDVITIMYIFSIVGFILVIGFYLFTSIRTIEQTFQVEIELNNSQLGNNVVV